MTTDQTLITLITKAGTTAGSEYKLAKAMGLPQTVLTDWKAGRRTCTPEDRARLAGFAREDALQEFVRATLEKTAGTLRGEQLRQLLGKSLHQTGAASVFVLGGMASLIYSTLNSLDVLRYVFRGRYNYSVSSTALK